MSCPDLAPLLAAFVALVALERGGARAQESPAGWHVAYRSTEARSDPAEAESDGEQALFGLLPRFDTGELHARVAHAALALPARAVPDARLGAHWEAVFATRLLVEDAGRYRFTLEVEDGQAQLVLGTEAGEPRARAGEWVELEAGEHALQVHFRPAYGTRGGAAEDTPRLRTLWAMEASERGGFRAEPIPTRVTRMPREALPLLAADESAFRGRVLLERKGCTNCHRAPENGRFAVGRRTAPRLDGLASRVSAAWVDLWIRAPDQVRHGADMPRLLMPNEEGRRMGDALVHFLASLKDAGDTGDDRGVAREDEVLRRGRDVYHRRGCVACHGALESPAAVFANELLPSALPAVPARAPFGDLRRKWRPSALSAFLRDPAALYPDGRMPSLALSEEEADLVATYLLRKWGSGDTSFPSDPDEAGFGRQVFIMLACAACHPIEAHEGLAATHALELPLDRLDPFLGCLDPKDEDAPRYDLTRDELRDLRAGIESVVAASGRPAPLDAARRTIELAGCASCHVLDGAFSSNGPDPALRDFFTSSADEVDLGDEGRLPPDLPDPGTKLTTHWLREVLLEGGRARPYLATRMPRYGRELVGALPEQLARREGLLPDAGADGAGEPVATDELVRIGRELMPRTALGCVACHVYKDWPAAGTPGPALTDFAERLRYEWYASYVATPQRTKPGSRMPSFGRGARSTLAGVLDGDLHRQAEAMWCYFTLGDAMPPPEGIEPDRKLLLTVGERPIVQRTFLANAGSRGIAVGLPVGVHFAFDAAEARLAYAWQGDFLDAAGIWAGRGGTIVAGQGDVVWTAREGPPLHVGELAESAPWPAASASDVRFRGYRLDEHGVPTFLYELDGLRVEETITAQAAPEIALMRHFRVRSDAPGVRFQVRRGGVGSFVTVRESDRGEGDRIELWTDEAGEQEFVSVVRP